MFEDKLHEVLAGVDVKEDFPKVLGSMERLLSLCESHIILQYEGTELLEKRLGELEEFRILLEHYNSKNIKELWENTYQFQSPTKY